MNTDRTRGRINPGPCAHCRLPSRLDGADQCIGWLPGGLMNACCGHGKVKTAYVQFSPCIRISGRPAWVYQRVLAHLRDLFWPANPEPNEDIPGD